MLALPIFLGRPRIVPPLKSSPVDYFRRKTPFLSKRKEPDKRLALDVGITYLPGQSPAKYCRRT